MEKIKIKGSSKSYEIRSIQTIEPHVMQIVFVGTPPTKWGDITLYTDGGIECATLTGWTTVYRDEGQTVYLSDDSSVYQTPDPDSWWRDPSAGTVCADTGRATVCEEAGNQPGM